jgi:hypothetical protein
MLRDLGQQGFGRLLLGLLLFTHLEVSLQDLLLALVAGRLQTSLDRVERDFALGL